VPLWVVGAAAGVFLTSLFAGLSFSLGHATEKVAQRVAALGGEIAVPRAVSPPRIATPDPADELLRLLQPEVERGLLRILDRGSVLRIVTVDLDLFASGQDTLRDAHLPLFRRIAAALKGRPGPIVVTGHTDGQPLVRSIAFPSNHALSLARAQTVARMLEQEMGSAPRVVAEGRADREPIAREDTLAGRQANRRVEIDVPKRRAASAS
jgi:type VI secretion system protein ImpK